MARRTAAFLALVLTAWSGAAPAADSNWVGSWATSQQVPEDRNALPAGALDDATLRQIVHLSIGGATIRVHLSNAFGTAPLHILAAHVARPLSPAGPALVAGSDRGLTFGGAADVTIPAGAEWISDPVAYRVAPDSDLAVSLHFERQPAQQTSHPGSRTNSYIGKGDQLAASDMPGVMKVEHWYFLGGVDVVAPPGAAAVVALGDSITDGRGSTTNGNDRWSDQLSRRLMKALPRRPLGMLNAGIGGNNILKDGLGPNAVSRVDRDILARAGVKYVIVLEGINDIGTFDREGTRPKAAHDLLVHQMTGALEQIVMRAHAAGIKVYGATITPFMDCTPYAPKPASEADRVAVNAWIRAPGHFDAVIDWDEAVRDPARPDHLASQYDSGDHLHLSPAGYGAFAASVPLSLFR
jgi:lysophospholipase L1-like esterase